MGRAATRRLSSGSAWMSRRPTRACQPSMTPQERRLVLGIELWSVNVLNHEQMVLGPEPVPTPPRKGAWIFGLAATALAALLSGALFSGDRIAADGTIGPYCTATATATVTSPGEPQRIDRQRDEKSPPSVGDSATPPSRSNRSNPSTYRGGTGTFMQLQSGEASG